MDNLERLALTLRKWKRETKENYYVICPDILMAEISEEYGDGSIEPPAIDDYGRCLQGFACFSLFPNTIGRVEEDNTESRCPCYFLGYAAVAQAVDETLELLSRRCRSTTSSTIDNTGLVARRKEKKE